MRRWLLATTLLSTLAVPSVASADPISMAIASTASSIFAAGGVAGMSLTLFGTTLATGWGAAFAQFAIRAALGYALQSLSKTGQRGSAGRGYTVNAIGSALPHQVIYGETRIGGGVFYQTTTGTANRYMHRCIAFAGHEIDSFTTFYLNDEALTLDGSGNVTAPAQYVGYVRILSHLGTTTQTADATLVSEVTEWTTNHRARGVAYAYVRYDYNATAFPNGIPTLTAKIKGKKVYDPRDGTTAWIDNPALIIRDYVTSDYGLNDSAINDTVLEEAADVCDEVVSSAKRYTCNGAFLLDAEPESVVQALVASMGGLFWFAQGKWGAKAAKYEAPTLTFDQDDLLSGISIATRNSRRDNFNTVRGIYRGEETNWQESDFTEVTNATYVTEDGGTETPAEIPLLFTDTDVMAQRIATIALKRNRKQVTITAGFGTKALQVGIGDTIKFTNTRMGWTEKVFEVNDWRFAMPQGGEIQVQMLLREIDSGVFT